MNRLASTLVLPALAALVLSPVCIALGAQTPAAQTPVTQTSVLQTPSAAVSPPMLPLSTDYHFWPVQFIQFVGPELPYSMIELDVDPSTGKHPLLYITLTERTSGKRIHYTDDDSLIAAAAPGDEVHKAALGFDAADTGNPGSISLLRFSMADGQPLEWRFVQGSDISEQGSGLNPVPDAKIPIFAYREQGGLAGEGTALQIGTTVSTAAVWTEYSHPPYFVGYRGAETDGAHTLVFLPGTPAWTVASAPASLVPGATWELDGQHGNHRSIHIDRVNGDHLTVTSTDRFQPRVHCTLEVTRAGQSWSIERARFSPLRDGDKHSLTLQFASPLSPDTAHVDLTLIAGKKKVIAAGQFAAADAANHTPKLSFSTPAWLNGETFMVALDAPARATDTAANSVHP